ncbi:MAG: glycosyltransferase, partial [Bacteroidaceae bacterium]|nr:glycosyltransferase [Bacteroidaceae bacterium]
MKVLIVNMSDARGGAAIVTYRLLQALNRQSGIEAKMVVADKQTDDPNVIALPRRWWWKKLLDRMVVWAANGFSRKNLWLTDGGFFGNDITHLATFQEADVIHLHWVNQGMLSLQDIQKVLDSGKRIVWTMHDMWPSTSICHHAGSCQRFMAERCHHCPQLRFPSRHDLAALRWERKKSLFAHPRVQIIACSSWMATYAQSSRITRHLPVTVIPNAFDCPPMQVSKETSQTVKTICFAAARIDTELKGFDDLLQALDHLRHRTDLELVLIGGLNDQRILQQIPIPYR